MSDMLDPRDCGGICYSGWITIDAYGTQTIIDASGKTRTLATSAAARCLCPKGQAIPAGFGVSIDKVFNASQLLELYVNGVPVVETAEVRKRDAQIPKSRWTWSLATFKASLGKRKEIQQCVTAAEAWINAKAASRPDVLLYGPNGVGKTGLATAVALALIDKQEKVLFVETRALFAEWRATFGRDSSETELSLIKRYVNVPVLILDEAVETTASDFTVTSLKMLVDRRQLEERPTIFTANVPHDAMGSSSAMASLAASFGPALFDRLREFAQFWGLAGASQRKPTTKVLNFDREKDDD